jgi:mannose-6-phosphate isomerase-like protein (cupin superfamily)
MRGSKKDLPKTMETSDMVMQEAEWGDMHVEFDTIHKKMDVTPLLKGLPNDRCQCPHWGYVLKGRMIMRNKDHEEIANAGDAYYMAPGHTAIFDAGTEVVEFSPKDKLKKTMEVIMRNYKAMQQKK